MNKIKALAFFIALFVLTTVALSGNYVKVHNEHPCNSQNTECDLSQENESNLFDQATVNRLRDYKTESLYDTIAARRILNGELYT